MFGCNNYQDLSSSAGRSSTLNLEFPVLLLTVDVVLAEGGQIIWVHYIGYGFDTRF